MFLPLVVVCERYVGMFKPYESEKTNRAARIADCRPVD
jgi:hypothetical protein